MVSLSVVVCFVILAATSATNVEQCEGTDYEGLSEKVQLSPCKRAPCRLKKGTTQRISIKFIPKNDVAEVTNHVSAEILGAKVPFIGVDGLSVCDKMYTVDGEKQSCPLKGGTEYMYKDSFPVLAFYPSINVKVQWALSDGKADIVCFQVPARIS